MPTWNKQIMILPHAFVKRLIYNVILASMIFSGNVLAENSTPDSLDTGKRARIVKNYILGPGDVLNVSVWKNADLSVTVPVRPDGKISTPLVDDIQAGGLTPEALAAGITVKLADFIRDPRVTVMVTQVNSDEYISRVRVTGAVRHPVSIAFKPGMTVMDVVLIAGGLTEFASANKTKLYRKTRKETQVYSVKLKDILNKGKLESNIQLRPGDIITIPERLL